MAVKEDMLPDKWGRNWRWWHPDDTVMTPIVMMLGWHWLQWLWWHKCMQDFYRTLGCHRCHRRDSISTRTKPYIDQFVMRAPFYPKYATQWCKNNSQILCLYLDIRRIHRECVFVSWFVTWCLTASLWCPCCRRARSHSSHCMIT